MNNDSITKRIALVVDDSMLIRHTVSRFMESRGFAVENADNGQAALEIIARRSPDIIVTDMEMPKMGGAELIAALKKNAGTANIPVIVVTASLGADNPGKTCAGAAATVRKDIDIEQQLAVALSAIFGKDLGNKARGAKA
jgi:CheY-like chemotaxis protein